ncbi:hypothetical protein RCL1_005332 [Eukaryota sp. TZLM3-RCL]
MHVDSIDGISLSELQGYADEPLVAPSDDDEEIFDDSHREEEEDQEDTVSTLRPGIVERGFRLPKISHTPDLINAHLASLELPTTFPKWSRWMYIPTEDHPRLPSLPRAPVKPGYLSPAVPVSRSFISLIKAPALLKSSFAPLSVATNLPTRVLTKQSPHTNQKSLDFWERHVIGSKFFNPSFLLSHLSPPSSLSPSLLPSLPLSFSIPWSSLLFSKSVLSLDLNDSRLTLTTIKDVSKLTQVASIGVEEEDEEETGCFDLDMLPAHRTQSFETLQSGDGRDVVNHTEPATRLRFTHSTISDELSTRWHRPHLTRHFFSAFSTWFNVAFASNIDELLAVEQQASPIPPLEQFQKTSHLSPSEGDFIIVEHVEERPPLLRNFGMGARLVVYRKEPPSCAHEEPHGIICRVPPNKPAPCLGGVILSSECRQKELIRSRIAIIEDNLSRAPVVNQQINSPQKSRDYILVLTPIPQRNTFRITLRKIPPNAVFSAGQQQPKREVYAPDSKPDKNYGMARLEVSIVRRLVKNGKVSKTDLEREFRSINDQTLKKALKKYCDHESGSTWRLSPSTLLPTEDQVRQIVSPDDVVVQEARILGERYIQDAKFHRFTSATTTFKQACLRFGCNDEAKKFGRIVDRIISMAAWKHTKSFVETIVNSKGLLAIPEEVPPLGLFTYRRIPQKPESRPQRRTDEPKSRTVTGTDADLRKLDPDKARILLQKMGMSDAEILKLERWDRVNMVRTLATQKAAEGCTDPEILQYCRNDKVTLEQQEQSMNRKAAKMLSFTLDMLGTPPDHPPSTPFISPFDFYARKIGDVQEELTTEDLFATLDDNSDAFDSDVEISNQNLMDSREKEAEDTGTTDLDLSLSTYRNPEDVADQAVSTLGTNQGARGERIGIHGLLHLPETVETMSDGKTRKVRTAVIRKDLDTNDSNQRRVITRILTPYPNSDFFVAEFVVNPKEADNLNRRAKTLKAKIKSLEEELSGVARKRKAPKAIQEAVSRRRTTTKDGQVPPAKLVKKVSVDEEEVIYTRDRGTRKRMTDAGAKVELNKLLHSAMVNIKDRCRAGSPDVSPLFIFIDEPDYKLFYDYKKIIENPLWMEKMIQKTSRDEYGSREDFLDDVRQMVFNAHLYNSQKPWYTDVKPQIDLLWKVLHDVVYSRDNDLNLARYEAFCAPKYHEKWREERGLGPDSPIEDARRPVVPPPPRNIQGALGEKQRLAAKKQQAQADFNNIIYSVIQQVSRQDFSIYFLQKPNPRDFPTYKDFVKKPFSLAEMSAKCKRKLYKTIDDVISDLVLIRDNAIIFNAPVPQNFFVIQAAEQLMSAVINTLEQGPEKAQVDECLALMNS